MWAFNFESQLRALKTTKEITLFTSEMSKETIIPLHMGVIAFFKGLVVHLYSNKSLNIKPTPLSPLKSSIFKLEMRSTQPIYPSAQMCIYVCHSSPIQ
jgi:hypothetical protein